MSAQEKLFQSIPAKLEGGELSQMFGKPCIKLNGKAFCCFFQDELVVKIGAEEANALMKIYEGSQLFDPSGKKRPMKDWLQVPYDYNKDWTKLAKQAAGFIEANEKPVKKIAPKKAVAKKTPAKKAVIKNKK